MRRLTLVLCQQRFQFFPQRTCSRELTRRLPEIARFVLRHLAATLVAGAIAALSDGKRAALADDVRKALLAYEDGDGISYREVAHVVMAVR